jgi:hypothetical protein
VRVFYIRVGEFIHSVLRPSFSCLSDMGSEAVQPFGCCTPPALGHGRLDTIAGGRKPKISSCRHEDVNSGRERLPNQSCSSSTEGSGSVQLSTCSCMMMGRYGCTCVYMCECSSMYRTVHIPPQSYCMCPPPMFFLPPPKGDSCRYLYLDRNTTASHPRQMVLRTASSLVLHGLRI